MKRLFIVFKLKECSKYVVNTVDKYLLFLQYFFSRCTPESKCGFYILYMLYFVLRFDPTNGHRRLENLAGLVQNLNLDSATAFPLSTHFDVIFLDFELGCLVSSAYIHTYTRIHFHSRILGTIPSDPSLRER